MVGALGSGTGFAGSILNCDIFHDAYTSMIKNLRCYDVVKNKKGGNICG